MVTNAIYVSATPSEYELRKSEGIVVEQIIRPTGLLDPLIDVRPSRNQVDDLLEEIDERVKKNERVLVTTLTKRMAEELTKYMDRASVKCRYIHSEVDTLDRVEILRELRLGVFDVLVGVNLLREGLDLPEVSLVAILDADKEGFLRNQRSLVQTIGRAARNENGRVIMYADKITESMQTAIDETNRRRQIQMDYNKANGITPKTIIRSKESILGQTKVADSKRSTRNYYVENEETTLAADPVVAYLSNDELLKMTERTKKAMEKAAKELEFIEAAKLRDEYLALQKMIQERKK
jgi:excinuclease ABC subunit B